MSISISQYFEKYRIDIVSKLKFWYRIITKQSTAINPMGIVWADYRVLSRPRYGNRLSRVQNKTILLLLLQSTVPNLDLMEMFLSNK